MSRWRVKEARAGPEPSTLNTCGPSRVRGRSGSPGRGAPARTLTTAVLVEPAVRGAVGRAGTWTDSGSRARSPPRIGFHTPSSGDSVSTAARKHRSSPALAARPGR